MRRSLKIRGRRKEKEKLPSGITECASFFAQLDRDLLDSSQNSAGTSWSRIPDGLTQSDSSEASLTSLTNAGGKLLPPLPPKPPKRGILKGPRLSITSVSILSESNIVPNGNQENNHQEASNLLVRNTLQNEVIAYQNIPSQHLLGLNNEGCSEEESSYQRQHHHHHHQHYHHLQQDSKLLQVSDYFVLLFLNSKRTIF